MYVNVENDKKCIEEAVPCTLIGCASILYCDSLNQVILEGRSNGATITFFKKMNYDFFFVSSFSPLSALKQRHQHPNCYSIESDPVRFTLKFNFP